MWCWVYCRWMSVTLIKHTPSSKQAHCPAHSSASFPHPQKKTRKKNQNNMICMVIKVCLGNTLMLLKGVTLHLKSHAFTWFAKIRQISKAGKPVVVQMWPKVLDRCGPSGCIDNWNNHSRLIKQYKVTCKGILFKPVIPWLWTLLSTNEMKVLII